MEKSNKKFSYDGLIAEVEEILQRLQNDDTLTFDAMLQKVDEAVNKLNQCKAHLTDAEKHIDELFKKD